MKIYLAIISFIFCFSCLGQSNFNLETYFLTNDAKLISDKFGNMVELNVDDTQANYDQKQAKVIFDNFFKQKKFTSYTRNHTGGGNGRPYFEIAELKTETETFRTYTLYNQQDNSFIIIELRIELEED